LVSGLNDIKYFCIFLYDFIDELTHEDARAAQDRGDHRRAGPGYPHDNDGLFG
jgi:hypothetical protein